MTKSGASHFLNAPLFIAPFPLTPALSLGERVVVSRCTPIARHLKILAGQRAAARLRSQPMTHALPRPEVIITHESDLDGLVAGVLLHRLARKLFNADVRLEACNYHYWRQ